MSFPERVRLLVERYCQGNTSEAARLAGVPQPTLFRILDGTRPRTGPDIVVKIAAGFGVSTDWLLTGEGRGPGGELYRQTAGHLLWLNRLRSLGLSDAALSVWQFVPTQSITGALGALAEVGAMKPKAHQQVSTAVDQAARAWLGLIDTLVATFGAPAIAGAMERTTREAGLDFNPTALKLLRTATTAPVAEPMTIEAHGTVAGVLEATLPSPVDQKRLARR